MSHNEAGYFECFSRKFFFLLSLVPATAIYESKKIIFEKKLGLYIARHDLYMS